MGTLLHYLPFILAILSTLGIGGFIALAIFAPALAAVVGKLVTSVFMQIISTRIGVGCLAGVSCLILGEMYGDHTGAARVKAQWDAAEKAAIAVGSNARSDAEKEIPPVASDDQPAAPDVPPAVSRFHIPFIHVPEAHNDCPPAPPAPACSPTGKRRPVDGVLRGDPHNRDNH